jgi:hypothetical protein
MGQVIQIDEGELNKREIGAKPPSVYMRTFEKRNAGLKITGSNFDQGVNYASHNPCRHFILRWNQFCNGAKL